MKPGESIRIRYLAHSAFLCETSQRFLVFDVGTVPPLPAGLEPDWTALLAGPKPVFAFSSHNHADHYRASLQRLFDASSHGRFVAGDFGRSEGRTVRVDPGADCQIDDCRIFSVAATDKGIAAFLEFPEACIYFGGDHAIWDDLPEFQKPYRTSMLRLAQSGIRPDLAFMPVGTSDGWQEEALLDGCRLAITRLEPRGVVPMHAYSYESFYQSFAERMADLAVPIAPIRRSGDQFRFDGSAFTAI